MKIERRSSRRGSEVAGRGHAKLQSAGRCHVGDIKRDAADGDVLLTHFLCVVSIENKFGLGDLCQHGGPRGGSAEDPEVCPEPTNCGEGVCERATVSNGLARVYEAFRWNLEGAARASATPGRGSEKGKTGSSALGGTRRC